MSSAEVRGLDDLKVDADNLYREELLTDMKAGSLRQLVPIKVDGSPDAGREPLFVAQTHVVSSGGPVPVQCRIDAKTLQEAVEKFPAAIKKGVEEMIEQVKELQRQQSSRIVVPQPGTTLGPGPGPGPAGGGPGKIHLS